MVARLVFAAMFLCALGSRPDAFRRRADREQAAPAAQAIVAPTRTPPPPAPHR